MRTCPKCKTTDFNNRTFTMMINECGHSLCSSCVDTLFARNTAPCPTCGKTLRLKGFWVQTLEDPMVEKEVYFRKKLSRTFNLLEEDFGNLRDFNDYLEMIETTVYNLVHDLKLEDTARNIQKFQKDNEQNINRNKNKKSKDDIFIQECLEEEEKAKQQINQRFSSQGDENEDKNEAAKAIITALKESHIPAEMIVNSKRREIADQEILDREKKKAKMKVKHELKQETVMRPVQQKEGKPFVYDQLVLDFNGPDLPDISSMMAENGHLTHIKQATDAQLAGGYHHMLACYRALTDATCDLYDLPTSGGQNEQNQ